MIYYDQKGRVRSSPGTPSFQDLEVHQVWPAVRPGKGAEHMRLVTLHVPEPRLRALDDLVHRGLYPNRSEAIREAIRDLIELHGTCAAGSSSTTGPPGLGSAPCTRRAASDVF